MVSNIPQPPPITAGDRLSMTLFLAIALHAILLLGISFNLQDSNSQDSNLPTMEIILVHQGDQQENTNADYLAQLSQQGGGEQPAQRPSSPSYNPLQLPHEGRDLSSQLETAPEPMQQQIQRPVMLAERAERRFSERHQQTPSPDRPDAISAQQLRQRSLELASINAEIRQLRQDASSLAREKYISASTREYKYASYFDAWRSKVERVGNLNYPDEAKRGQISGTLLLDVAIFADGSIRNVTLLRSSGHKILDDAAERIVRMAAPYAPFPDDLKQDYDVIHFTRTWQFQSGGLETHAE